MVPPLKTHMTIRGVLLSSMSIITVRQTRDPFCGVDIEYVASCKVTLEANGDLNMKKIGGRIPTDQLALYNGRCLYYRDKPLVPAGTIKYHLNINNEPILTVITLNDYNGAECRNRRAEQIKYWKGLFPHVWTWLPSPLCPETSSSDESQTNKVLRNLESYFCGLRSSILTCLRPKDDRGGGYVKLKDE